VTRRGEGRERDAGRDTGTAVGTDSAIVVDAALGEQSGERVLRQKRAVAIEHIAAGQVFGAGDVSGDTIDRLNLTPEAFGCARVEQCQVCGADLICRQGRQRSGVQIVVQRGRIARWWRNQAGRQAAAKG